MRKTFAVISVILLSLTIFSFDSFATLVPKINNLTQAELTLQTGCVGGDLSFTGSYQNLPPYFPVTYATPRWTGTAAAWVVDDNAPTAVFNCPTPGDYSLTLNVIENGVTYFITQSIKVINKDLITLVSPATLPLNVCQGTSINMEASGTKYYYWEREILGVVTPNIGFTAAISETPPTFGTWTYRVYGGNDGCESDPSYIEFQVIVDEAAIVDAGGSYSTCAETGVTLSGSIGGSATSAEWIGGAGSFVPNRTTLNAEYTPHASETGTDVVLILRTDDPVGVCSFEESSTTVTVNTLPIAPTAGNVTVCYDGASHSATATAPAGSSVVWYTSAIGGAVTTAPTGTAAGTYTAWAESVDDITACVSSTRTQVTLTLNALPLAPTAGNVTVCYNGASHSAMATAPAGSSVVWYDNAVGGNITVAPTGTADGIYTAWAVSVDNITGCESADPRIQVTLTINALPAAPTAGSISACYDGASHSATATAPAGSSVVWYNSAVGGIVTTAPTGTAAGTYTAWAESVDDVTGCLSSIRTQITLTINALPLAPTAGNVTVCYDGAAHSATATAPAGSSVVWYDNAVGGVIATAPTATADGIYTAWAVSVDNITGCESADPRTQVNLTINALPVAPTAGNVTVCYDGASHSATATAPAGSSLVWYTSSVGGVVTTAPTATNAGTYTAWAESVDNVTACLSSIRTQVILIINALPAAPTAINISVCFDGASHSASATAPAGSSVVWYTSAVGGVVTTAPTGTAAGTYTAWAESVDDITACVSSTRTQVTLTLNALPLAPTAGNVTVCYNGASHSAMATAPAGSSVVWYDNAVGGNITTAPTGTAIGTYTAWAVSVDNITNCESVNPRTQVTLTINTLPAAPTANNETVCFDGASHNASATPPVGASVVWYDSAIGGSITTAPTGTAAGTYIAWAESVYGASGCSSDSRTQVTLTINLLPIQYNVTGGGSYCAGDAGALVGLNSSQSGVTYTLYKGGVPTTTIQLGSGGALNFGFQTVGVYTVFAEVNLTGCSQMMFGSATVTEIPAVIGNTITADHTICSGSTPDQLDGPIPTGGSGGYNYQWKGSTVSTTGPFTNITGANGQNFTPGALTQTTYFVREVTSGVCTNQSNTVTVTVNPPIANNTISLAQTICYNTVPSLLTGSTPTGGSGAYTYQWQISTTALSGPFTDILGATDVDYQPGSLTQDTWFRRIVNSLPCTNNISNVIEITVGSEFLVTGITPINPTCNGLSNGSATVNTSGGIAPYTYSWTTTPAQTMQTATGLSAGINYTVTVTDASMCVAVGNVTLTEPAAIGLASVTANPVTGCFGGNNGSILIEANGGTPNYTYTLFLGVTQVGASQTPVFPSGANFTGLLAGTYSVRITDVNSCPEYTESNIIVSQPALLGFTYITVDLSCYGDNSGEIHFTATGGTAPYQYSINNGITWVASPDFVGLSSANYSLRVKDNNGCITARQLVKINQPSQLFSDGGTWQDVITCSGGNTGSITVIPGGGVPPYQFSINGGTTWQGSGVFPNLFAGTYTIIVEDASGCSINVGPITINQPDPIDILSVDITNVTICSYSLNGEIFVWASGGTGDLEFSIDGGTTYQLDPLFENVGIGTYSIFVRDGNGCGKYAGDYVVTGPPAIVINAPTVTNATCFGASDGTISITASGGTGVLEFSINGTVYQATGNFIGLSANTYTLYVRDANGCIQTQTATVSQPTPLYFTTQDGVNITCNGLADGQITLIAAGGSAPYTYSITGGAPFGSATGIFNGLIAGTYVAAVRDASGCSTIGDNIVITEPALLAIGTQASTDIVCFGETNGTITVTANGGTNPLTYTLLDAGLNVVESKSTGDFTGISAGVYTVDIDDANSCGPITAGPFTIAEPADLTFTYTKVDLTCFGVPTGQIDVDALGGIPPYQYSFDGGLTFGASDIQIGMSGGNHTVIVRDANLCETSQVINLIEPAELVISLTPTNITCNGLTDGQIVATATGGTTLVPYQFRIDGGAWQASGTFTGLSAGPYLIEVQDANGCIDGDNITLTEPSIITIDAVTPVNATCTTLGSITVEASGGTGVLTYTLNPGAVVNTSGVFPNLATGDYTVDINDVNGCGPISTGTISLVSPPAIVIDDIIVTNVTGCFGDSNGSIEIQTSGGTAPLNYSIDNGATFQLSNIFNGLPAGNYDIVVNDINNCPQTATRTITQPTELQITGTTVNQESSAGAGDGSITVTATGGTGVLTYTLQPNAISNTTGVFNGLGAGTYQVVVTDENVCTKQTGNLIINGVTVTVIPTMVSCNGLTDGEILVTIVGGFPPFNVLCTRLSDAQSFPVNDLGGGQYLFENLNADDYLISITDAVPTAFPGRQVTITEPDAIIASYVSHTNPTCNGLVDGTVEFNITGGTLPYTITWTGGSSVGNIANGVGAGTFIFTITDANGCFVTVNDVPEITEPAGIQIIELTQFDPTCNGESIGLINVTATGGFGTLTYTIAGTINVSNQTGVFDNLPAGVYDLSITDANGCNGNFDPPVRVTLTEPSPIVITGLTPTVPLTCPNVPEGFVRIQVSGGQPDYSFLWSNGQTGVDLENVVVGDYTVIVTDALNCKVSKTFTVAGPPMLELSTLITQAQCRIKPTGDDGRIEITGTTGGNGSFTDLIYSWNDKFSTTGPIVGNISGGTYTVTITDLSSCVYTFDYEVPINPRFDYHAFAGKDSTVCYDNPVVLHGIVNGGDADLNFTYEWFEIPNTAGDPIFRGADFNIQLTEAKSYLLRVTDDDLGCLDTTRINLKVYPNIGLEVPMYISAVQDTTISVLMGKEFNMDVITQSVEFETTFEWKPSEMFLPSNSWNSTLIFNNEIKSQIEQNYTPSRFVTLQDPVTKRRTEFILVDVIAKTEKGCIDSIRLYTKIVEDLAFGNVFSPNGDGINDRWIVPKSYLFPDLEIEVFNRWGSLVWSAKGDNAAKGWDGRTNNGQELPIGTYYYVLKYNVNAQGSNWKPLTGSITIVK